MSRHSDRARLALARLADADPTLGALALWCGHRDGDGPTRTRGDTILYGPEFPLLPIHEQIGLAGHHVLHVTLRHSARMAAMAARRLADQGCRVIALAQFSLARARDAVAAATGLPVLTTPDSAVRRLRARLQAPA